MTYAFRLVVSPSPPQTLSIAFALLAGLTLALPVTNEAAEAVPASASAAAEPTKESTESLPEGTIFNYEAPTEDELSPADLDEEEKRLQELLPPAIDSYVPFRVDAVPTEKPRKGGKKYNKEEKWINKHPSSVAGKDVSGETNEERQYALLDFIIENLFAGIADQYTAQRRDLNGDEGQEVLVLNKGEYMPSPQRRNDEAAAGDEERILFQIHGHQGGANSYKFGFDTGKK